MVLRNFYLADTQSNEQTVLTILAELLNSGMGFGVKTKNITFPRP